MESEKVKEIKEALEYAIDMGFVMGKNTMFVNIKLADILTLINELESENERLSKELDSEWKDRRKAEEDLHKAQWNYKIGLGQSQSVNKKLKDRIAELEKENKDYYDRLNNLQAYIDNHEEIWKGNTDNALKQFAERLKEKAQQHYEDDTLRDFTLEYGDVEDTLKEFINKGDDKNNG